MKNLKIILSILAIGLFSSQASAQKIKVVTGDLSSFAGLTEINVEYNYDDMGVGKFKTEEAYIEKKKNEYNEDEPGKGDRWEEEWHADKENTYQMKFEQLFNLVMISEETGMEVGFFPSSDYTLIVKTTFLEPGFNIGISRKDASINVEIMLVKTEEPGNIITQVNMEKVPGRGAMGGDFDTEYRIGEAYAKCGKELAQYIYKKGLK
ncbi:MAG: hypothetical protein V2I47_06410 [Bacteroidales bacterium]|jgi:hypothetical protein|nr:hypothetical protein [Bacteroidales bacterium]